MRYAIPDTLRTLAMAWSIVLVPSGAMAVPITGSETIFTFDFTTLSPAPPYTNIEFGAIFAASDPVTVVVDRMSTLVYGGANGTGLLQTRDDSAPGFFYDVAFSGGGTVYGPLTTANAIFNPMLDGVFSFGLAMNEGSAELLSFSACGLTNGIRGPCVTLPVPELPTDALLLVGLLGVATVARGPRRLIRHAPAHGHA